MKILGNASLKARVTLLTTVLVGVVWLLAALATWIEARHEAEEVFDAHLAQSAALLAAHASHELAEDDGEEIEDLPVPQFHRYARGVAFQVWLDGRLLVRSANAPPQALGPMQEGFFDSDIGGASWRVFSGRPGERGAMVQVGELAAARESLAREIAAGLLRPLVLALPLLAALIWLAVWHGMRPLERVAREVEERSPRHLAPLALDGLPGEARPLVERLNLLLGRLAESIDQERRFTADAAHELRTPLAGLRAQAQVAMGATDEADRDKAFANLLAGCDRMARLIEQLLNLARVDAARGTDFSDLDLAGIAWETVAQLAGTALAKGVSIEAAADAPVPVCGNGTWLAVLARNLVDNAVRYSPPGSRVLVTARAEGNSALLRVEDDGPGVPPGRLPDLGRRFQRGLANGPEAEAESGSGLGLSIVRRVADLHGGSVEFTATDPSTGRGLCARVRLPLGSSGCKPVADFGA